MEQLHNVLHGLHTGRGTGISILELKLAKELSIMEQDPLLLVFLNLLKAYNIVDHGRLLTTLE